MAEYAFRRFTDEKMRSYGIDPLPVPVRAEKEEEIFGGDKVHIDLMLQEIELFRKAYPDLSRVYAGTQEIFAWMEAMRVGKEGDAAEAARCLEIGLEAGPTSLLLRSNYALSLQLQGKGAEALQQYEAVLADPDGARNPMVCLLAARLYAEQGKPMEAYRLLQPLARNLPAGDPLWVFFVEMKRLAGVEDEKTTCPACGQAMKPGARFCTTCGRETAVETPQRTVCPACGNPLEEGLAFCNKCGKAVEAIPSPRAFCSACGNPLEEGLAFCNKCGKAVGAAQRAQAACSACGNPLEEGLSFCNKCGKKT